jgi:tRNA (guanine-N7-)-methyltransferase
MGDALLDAIVRLLEDGGELFVQTDVEERAVEYETRIAEWPVLVPAGDAPGSARLAESPFVARSPRERRAMEDGLPIHRLLYRRAPRIGAPAGFRLCSAA